MYNRVQERAFSNVSTTQGPFNLRGGAYVMTVTAQWSGGTVGLQRLAADGVTFIDTLVPLTQDGAVNVNVPAGSYQLNVNGATGVYASVNSIVIQ